MHHIQNLALALHAWQSHSKLHLHCMRGSHIQNLALALHAWQSCTCTCTCTACLAAKGQAGRPTALMAGRPALLVCCQAAHVLLTLVLAYGHTKAYAHGHTKAYAHGHTKVYAHGHKEAYALIPRLMTWLNKMFHPTPITSTLDLPARLQGAYPAPPGRPQLVSLNKRPSLNKQLGLDKQPSHKSNPAATSNLQLDRGCPQRMRTGKEQLLIAPIYLTAPGPASQVAYAPLRWRQRGSMLRYNTCSSQGAHDKRGRDAQALRGRTRRRQ